MVGGGTRDTGLRVRAGCDLGFSCVEWLSPLYQGQCGAQVAGTDALRAGSEFDPGGPPSVFRCCDRSKLALSHSECAPHSSIAALSLVGDCSGSRSAGVGTQCGLGCD